MINGAVVRNSTHILLGVCTYQRPQMLLRCLLSIRRLQEPEGTTLTIVVVDNEPVPTVHDLVQTFSGSSAIAASPVPILYVHQPRRGIAQARNAILAKADEIGASWIAMLDDDQVVGEEWLAWMWRAAMSETADVIKSTVQYEMPDPRPAWALAKPKCPVWKFDLHITQTNGVLFRAGLTDKHGALLRFDESMALTGGEDSDFFARAYQAGAYIILTPEATAFEYLTASRLTFSAQVGRCYWNSFGDTRRDMAHYGYITTMVCKSAKFTGALFKGLTALAFVPFAALSSRQSARRKVLRGCKSIATAAGISSGLLGIAQPEPYRIIHGS